MNYIRNNRVYRENNESMAFARSNISIEPLDIALQFATRDSSDETKCI